MVCNNPIRLSSFVFFSLFIYDFQDLPGNARFAPEVLNFRSREFTRFLRQVCSHHELSKDEVVERFLTANEYVS